MKNLALLLLILTQFAIISTVSSQNVSISATGVEPDASAMVDIISNSKGLLIPRMTQTERSAISSPANSLLVYQTDGIRGFYYYSTLSSSWTLLASSGGSIISLNGLMGVNQTFATSSTGTDFTIGSAGSIHTFNLPDAAGTARGVITTGTQTIGGSKTFSSAPLFSSLTAGSVPFMGTSGLVSQNNANFFWDATNTRLGIGTNAPAQKFDVNGTIISSSTSYPNYAYNSANRMAFGESNVPLNETGSVVQYGSGSINRNMLFAFTKTNINTSFLGNDGTQMMLGTESTIPITFRTNLSYTASNIMASGAEAMRITNTGRVGIGTTTPATALHVTATNPLTLIGVALGTNTSTDSLLTITSGLVRKLPLSTFASTANALSSLNGLTATSQTFAVPGATGTAPAWSSAVSVHTLNIPLASAGSVTAGLLSNAEYIVFNTKQPQLTGTGFVKASGTSISYDNSSYLTSNQSITFAPTGDVTGSASGTVSLTPALTIAAGVVANAKLANVATQTFKGRTTAGEGAPEDITGTQATTMLNTFGTLKGLVPGVVSSTSEFLRADGTFAVPSGTTNGTVTSVSISTANGVSGTVATNTTTPAITLTLGALTPVSVAASGAVSGSNLSGTNAGDETTATIKTKLGAASGTTDGYLTLADWNIFNDKATPSNSWSTTGNAGTTAGTNFIGTTSATDFVTKTNNVERMRLVNSNGYLGIGTSSPATLLSLETIAGGGANDNLTLTSYNNTGGAPDPAIRIRAATGTPASPGFINAGTEVGALIGNTWNGSGLADVAKINFIAEQNLSASVMGTRISFFTASGASNITEKMRLDQNGSLGVGATGFNTTNPEKLLIDAGVSGNTTYQNVLVAKGNTNSYAQLNIQNSNSGAAASSDVVATNDAGTESNLTGFVDMGINSSGNTSTGVLGGNSTAYLYSTGNDFAIGNNTSTKSLNFFTTDAGGSAERMRIDGTGKVGIGNAAPSEKLDVTGNIRFSGALMPGNSPGTINQVLTSGGAGAVPTWSNAGTVTSLSVGTANGLAGTVSASTTAPVITLTTTVTGIVKGNGTALSAATAGDFPTLNQNTTGNAATVTTNANLTGDVTSVGNASSIANASIINAKLANMATQTFKGRTTAGSGIPEDLSASQATAILNIFNTSLKGLVPASGGSATTFLNGAGTFTTPTGAAAISSLNTLTAATQTFATGTANSDFNIVSNSTTHTFNLPDASTANRGVVTTGAQTIAGSKTFSSAPTFSTFTAGSVPFIGTGGLLSQNNTNLFWDATNSRLGVSTTSPTQKLDVNGTIVASGTTYPNYAYNSANRMAFGESNVPANETGSVVQYGSGANTRNMLFAFTKTNVNTSFLGNDGGQMMLGTEGAAPITFRVGLVYGSSNIMASGSEAMRIASNSSVGIGIVLPTAVLQLKAGTTTAGTAPLKLTQGVNMTTAETGAVEFDGTNYFATSGTTRFILAKTLTITQTVDFTSTINGNSNSTTVALTGAADGDVVFLGVPNGSSSTANTSFTAFVSAAGVVTLKFLNNSGSTVDPPSGIFRISILKY